MIQAIDFKLVKSALLKEGLGGVRYICFMQQVVQAILELYKDWRGKEAGSVDVLPQSGSERRYFRIHEQDGSTIIGTYGANIKENETFFYFSENFFGKQLPVANILAISNDRMFYLQEDFGDVSLIDRLESEGYTDEIYGLFQKKFANSCKTSCKWR